MNKPILSTNNNQETKDKILLIQDLNDLIENKIYKSFNVNNYLVEGFENIKLEINQEINIEKIYLKKIDFNKYSI